MHQIENELKFPLLSTNAEQVLIIPASSGNIEGVFSIASLSSGACNRRGSLSDKHLENETLLKTNEDFIKF